MNATSLNPLREALITQGLPVGYVSRTIDELNDHLSDADSSDAVGRLGDPRRLAKTFVREYRRSSFSGRHPVVSILLLTGVVMPAVIVGYSLGIVILAHVFAILSGWSVFGDAPFPVDQLSPEQVAIVYVLFALGSFVPFVFVAWLASRSVRRIARGTRWAMGVFVLMTLLSSMYVTGMHLAQSADESSSIQITYGPPLQEMVCAPASCLSQPLVQSFVMICCGWLFCRRRFAGFDHPLQRVNT